MQHLFCPQCETTQPETNFFICKRKKTGRQTLCKTCHGIKYKHSRNIEKYNLWAREYRKTDQNKLFEKEFRQKYLSSIDGAVNLLYNHAKHRAIKKNIEFNLDKQILREKITHMKCEATGIELSFNKMMGCHRSPFSPSLDRIDNTRGYTNDNIMITCLIYNTAKGEWPIECLKKMVKAMYLAS